MTHVSLKLFVYLHKTAIATVSSSECSNSGVFGRFQMMKQINKILVRLVNVTVKYQMFGFIVEL